MLVISLCAWLAFFYVELLFICFDDAVPVLTLALILKPWRRLKLSRVLCTDVHYIPMNANIMTW